MAHILIKNSLSELKAAKLNVNIPTMVTTTSEGDPIFVLETGTTYLSASGIKIRPEYVDKVNGFKNIDEALANSISKIASQIDWTPLTKDDSSPYVIEKRPVGSNVSISSNVYIELKDDTPSAGIDLSDVQIFLDNGVIEFDITDECEVGGTPLSYSIHWRPPFRIMTQ